MNGGQSCGSLSGRTVSTLNRLILSVSGENFKWIVGVPAGRGTPKTFFLKLSSYKRMPETTESELIAKFKSGDLSVFNILTRRWYETILGLLYRVLGDIDEAEDVCQKTFITVYFRLHQLNDNEKFRTWLYRIANNCAIDHLRERRHSFQTADAHRSNGSDGTQDLPETSPADLEGRIDGTALRRLCENALGSLPEEQRVVVVMKLYQDLKFIEIAEVLNVPVNTVKTRMYTGLRSLKEILNKNRLIEEILRNAM